MKLQTRDILGVDLLAAGGPYHGTGSPPEGDFYTEADLRKIADHSRLLMERGELSAPVKLGHSEEQKLLRASGYTDGEMPAAGWVDNIRVEGGKLKGDLRRVPAKLADLFDAGAFRKRSLELRSMRSQQDGQTYSPVVRAISWLGAKAPAVRTLDDVVALYTDQTAEDGVKTVDYAEDATGDWNPAWGYRAIQEAIHTRLAQEDGDYRVVDIGPDRALVKEGAVTWVVGFDVKDDGVQLQERGEWSLGQPDWALAAAHVIEMCETGLAHDNQVEMTEIALSQEQVTAFAEKLGIEPDSFTVDAAVEKVEELKALAEREPETPEDKVVLEKDLWEQTKKDAAEGAQAARKLYEQEREALLTEAMSSGKINPGDREKWVTRYDENPQVIREVIADIPANDGLSREYGREEEGVGDAERALADEFDRYMGIEQEEGR